MRTIAVMNQKGGVGKSTTAVNIASALGAQGKRVLLIDCDPQANASKWFGVKDAESGKALLNVLTEGGKLSELVRAVDVPGVELVASSVWLRQAETALVGRPAADGRLRNALRKLGNAWDYLLVDCPPALGPLSLNALAACAEVLVPVEASSEALEGLQELRRTIKQIRELVNEELTITGILVCRYDTPTAFEPEAVERLRQHLGRLVFRTIVRKNIRVKEAYSHGRPVTIYAPSSPGAKDYKAAASELAKRSTQECRELMATMDELANRRAGA